MKIKTLIVDDEPIARKGVSSYVTQVPFLELVDALPDPISAIEILSQVNVDLLLLDINMPELSGIQLLKSFQNPPTTIIVTAHPEHALEGFELDVVDYIVKPVSFERFMKAINKAREFIRLKTAASLETKNDYFFIKDTNRIEKIKIGDVLFIESLQNYSAIYTNTRKYMALISLKSLEKNLPSTIFMKVHKSYIINIDKIETIQQDEILIGKYIIPISRGNRDEILKNILGNRMVRRKSNC